MKALNERQARRRQKAREQREKVRAAELHYQEQDRKHNAPSRASAERAKGELLRRSKRKNTL